MVIKRIESIAADLRKCNGKCRKCRFLDRFSGECMRANNALEYIKIIEDDNAKEKVYCKDCIYCQKIEPNACYRDIEYRCIHKGGLSSLYVKPMDYCSLGKTNGSAEVEGCD